MYYFFNMKRSHTPETTNDTHTISLNDSIQPPEDFTEEGLKKFMTNINKKIRVDMNSDIVSDKLDELIKSKKTDVNTLDKITKLIKCLKCNDFMDSTLKVCLRGHTICNFCYNDMIKQHGTEYMLKCFTCPHTYQNHYLNHAELMKYVDLFTKIKNTYNIQAKCILESCGKTMPLTEYNDHKKDHNSCTKCSICNYIHDVNLKTVIDHYVLKHNYIICHISDPIKTLHIGFNNKQQTHYINSQSNFDMPKLIMEWKKENSIVLFDLTKNHQDHKFAKSLNLYKYTINFEVIPICDSQVINEHKWRLDGSDKTIITNSENKKGQFEFAFEDPHKLYSNVNLHKEHDDFNNIRIIIDTYIYK